MGPAGETFASEGTTLCISVLEERGFFKTRTVTRGTGK